MLPFASDRRWPPAGGLLLPSTLFSSGLTLIWGMMNFINFAHGEFVMLGMYVSLLVVVWLGGGPAAFGFAAAFGLFVLGVLGLPLAYSIRVARAHAGADSFDLRTGAAVALHSVLDFFREFRVAAANIAVGHDQYRRDPDADPTAGRWRDRNPADDWPALDADAYTIGSQLLAVSEDRGAAMLMGIKPDRMQALAWGLSAGAAGIAGALMAIAYPWSPSVGETFGLTAFVVVALGGFGSVPGALIAGLIIGLIQALSAFWFGPIYKDIVVYGLFVACCGCALRA